jgi:parallel beta-helix repeat protein
MLIFVGCWYLNAAGAELLVPTQFPAIQAAINAAFDYDTVLVDAGIYSERLDFLGKDIVVTSRYLQTGDSSTIVNTILDAGGIGSAVRMTNGEGESAVFMGFTVRNGAGSLYQPGYGEFYVGGGFYLINASPLIQFNIIRDHSTPDGGSGIFSDGGSPRIHRNTIVQNITTNSGCGAGMLIKNAPGGVIDSNYVQFNTAYHGGGIALKNAHPLVTRNVITHNIASQSGGAIRIYTSSHPNLINNTISDNSAPTGGGVQVLDNSDPVFMNNIVSFTSSGAGFVVIGACAPQLSYNLFYENSGGDYVNIAPGLGDINGDPAYVGGIPFDYHLTGLSAAINMGNPNPIYNDPDQTRNDIGAFYYPVGPPVPVELHSFSAAQSADGVTLTWCTAGEINCWGWLVERADDGSPYQAVSPWIAGQGTSPLPGNYRYTDRQVTPGCTYTYRLQQIDLSGTVVYSDPIQVRYEATAAEFSLEQNYPNPFNPTTHIRFGLDRAGAVRICIYDAAGGLVQVLADGNYEAGMHTLTWNAREIPSGRYLCNLNVNGQTLTRIITLLK